MFKPVLEEHLRHIDIPIHRDIEEVAKIIGLVKDRVNFVP